MDFEYHINRHREQVSKGLKLARNVLVIVLIALFLEVFLFNINHYRSSGYETISLDDELTFTETKGESYRITAANHLFEIHDLNKEVKNIHIEFDQAQPAQVVPIQINFTDSAHESYFYDTEFTAGIPLVDVSTNNWQSQYIYLETTGYVDDLRIDFGDSETLYPLVLKSLTINAPEPFFFNNLRFMLVLGVLLLIYCFRPKSAIYRIFIVKHERKAKAGIIATMLVEIALVSSFILMGSNLVGVATSSYNSGSWDGKSPVTFFEVGGDNAQQYAELAKSMTRGELYLEEEPPEWLVKMDNPYDKSARDEFQKATGEEPLFDVAYYDGHYYVYFGVLPVLIFYLPFYLITGANFPTAIGVLICCILFIAGCTALLHRFARFHFKRVSLGLFLLLQIPLIFCSGMLYLAKFPTFYSLPIIMALALVVWGLYFWMRGRTSKRAGKWYLVGSLCMALVVAPPAVPCLLASGLPAVLAQVHHVTLYHHAKGYARVRLPGLALHDRCARCHGIQLRTLRLSYEFRRELQPHAQRHDTARHGVRAFLPGALRLLLANPLHRCHLSLATAYALRYHLYRPDGERGYVRRHLYVLAGPVGALLLEAPVELPHSPARDTNRCGRDLAHDRCWVRGRLARCADGGHPAALLC